MRCPACGSATPAESGLCAACGSPLGGVPQLDARPAGEPLPLVGRREELRLLRQRFAEARDGHGQVVLLAGEPGIGKSHLARLFATGLAAEGWPALECWCAPEGTNTPLGPFVDLVGRLAASSAPEPGPPTLAGLAALARRGAGPIEEVVPLLADLLELPPAAPWAPLEISPQAQRKKTLEALLGLLLALAEERPRTLTVEDLQWADPSSLELLDLLVAEAPDAPLLLLLTFRPDFGLPWAWRPRVSHLPLSRLERGECEDLAELAAAGSVVPPAARDEIVRRSGGIPLFVVEMTRAAVGASRSAAGGEALPREIPATLRESLSARLEGLGGARAVAQCAAVLGHSFSQELLAAVSPGGEAALAPELDRLVASGLLRRSGFGWRSSYEFNHALVQEAAYESLAAGERRRLHRTIVRELDRRFPELVDRQPELAARHATAAGLTDRALALWQRAGLRAFARSANVEAVAHFRQALALVATLPPAAERDRRELELLTGLGPALIATRGYGSADVETTYRRAGELSREWGDAEQRLRVLLGLQAVLFSRGEFTRARRNLQAIRGLARAGDSPVPEIHFQEGSGAIALFSGDFAAAERHLRLGDAASRGQAALPAAGHDCRTAILSSHALVLWHLGYPEQALARYGEAAARAGRLEHPFSALFALHMGVWLRQLRREPESVAEGARELLARGKELEAPYLKAEGEVFLGWALACRRPPGPETTGGEDAIARLRRGIAEHEPLGLRFGATYRDSLLAEACIRWRRLDEAAEALARARDEAEVSGGLFRVAELHRLEGELVLARGGDDAFPAAEAAFRRALETARGQHARSLELRAAVGLGRLWRRLGRAREARELVSSVHGWFTEGAALPDLVEAQELLGEL